MCHTILVVFQSSDVGFTNTFIHVHKGIAVDNASSDLPHLIVILRK